MRPLRCGVSGAQLIALGGGGIPGKAFGLEARVYGVELDLGGIMRLQAGLGFGFGV